MPVAPAAITEGYFLFHDPELRACSTYRGYVVATTEPRLDPTTGQVVSRTLTTNGLSFRVPCLALGLSPIRCGPGPAARRGRWPPAASR